MEDEGAGVQGAGVALQEAVPSLRLGLGLPGWLAWGEGVSIIASNTVNNPVSNTVSYTVSDTVSYTVSDTVRASNTVSLY